MKPGRNDPCPCRNGKKYKKCCIENVHGGFEFQRRRLRRMEALLVERVLPHAVRRYGG